MSFTENENINLIESIFSICEDPNDFFPFHELLYKYEKNIDSFFSDNYQNNYIINPKIKDIKEKKEEKSIIFKSNLEKKDKKEVKEEIPSIYYFEDILQAFPNKDIKEKNLRALFNKINFVTKIEEVKKRIQFLENKTKSTNNDFDYDLNELIEKKSKNILEKVVTKKRGRKPTKQINHISTKTHDKMMPDNIIKKLKGKIFEYAILFLNNILNKTNEKEKLVNLNYKKYINRLKREEDLKYLNMKLKELFSKEISERYTTKKKDFNKKLINKVLNQNKDETIKFAFNMTLRDWLDIFTLKKSVEELVKDTDKNIDCEKIKNSIYGVDTFIKEILDKNDEQYLTPFIFLLYNYERWFSIKKGRKRNQKQ